jgi:phosphoribosylaminoimidazole carboxylase PurE protein
VQDRKDDKPLVGILMGSPSDLPVMEAAGKILDELKIAWEMRVSSAHRSPEKTLDYARQARKNGIRVIIAGAGWAAHLAGVVASSTTLPVIGVPIESSPLRGFDALLSIVQMPPGVPVATTSIGKGGAKNAGILAAQILALQDEALEKRLAAYKERMAEEVEQKDEALQKDLASGK